MPDERKVMLNSKLISHEIKERGYGLKGLSY
jgi:hypothetical protein